MQPLKRRDVAAALRQLAAGQPLTEASVPPRLRPEGALPFPGRRVLVGDARAVRREVLLETLARLGGVEHEFFVQIGADKIMGVTEGDEERTREDGKTSSVHFLRFPLEARHIPLFRDPATAILIGCGHESYSHLAGLSPATRAELARDLA